eukprot:1921418-Amphidinium_carterae.1
MEGHPGHACPSHLSSQPGCFRVLDSSYLQVDSRKLATKPNVVIYLASKVAHKTVRSWLGSCPWMPRRPLNCGWRWLCYACITRVLTSVVFVSCFACPFCVCWADAYMPWACWLESWARSPLSLYTRALAGACWPAIR